MKIDLFLLLIGKASESGALHIGQRVDGDLVLYARILGMKFALVSMTQQELARQAASVEAEFDTMMKETRQKNGPQLVVVS